MSLLVKTCKVFTCIVKASILQVYYLLVFLNFMHLPLSRIYCVIAKSSTQTYISSTSVNYWTLTAVNVPSSFFSLLKLVDLKICTYLLTTVDVNYYKLGLAFKCQKNSYSLWVCVWMLIYCCFLTIIPFSTGFRRSNLNNGAYVPFCCCWYFDH